MATANVKAVITADDRASKTIAGVGTSFGKLTASMAAGQLIANGVSKAFNILTDTIKSSVGAAFDQVRQVENSTIALKAYEKNGAAVNKVLKDLISFARSDMGVLFQREDLFAAAQTLKLYGQSTDTLTDKVKILAKGVSLGKTTFQELSSIVGRAAAKGRLDAVDFDMLIERGIGLDKSFRGATVTAEELFKELDRALPADLLRGRANTIDGLLIRLRSSFRDLGGLILGVNTETSQFIRGGLGDQFTQWIRQLTEYLKSPEFKANLQAFTDWLAINLPRAIMYLKNELLPDLIMAIQALWPVIKMTLRNLAELLKFVAEHKGLVYALATAFVILKTAMGIVKVVSAFTSGMKVVRSSYIATRAVISVPIPIVIAVAAGIAALALIRSKAIETWNTIDGMNRAIAGAESSKADAVARLRRLAQSGNKGQRLTAISQLQKMGQSGNIGGLSFNRGGYTGQGGANEVAGIVHKGEYVLPKQMVDQSTGTPKGGGSSVTININAGAYMGSQQDARRYAEQIVNALKDTALMKGQSVAQVLA